MNEQFANSAYVSKLLRWQKKRIWFINNIAILVMTDQ